MNEQKISVFSLERILTTAFPVYYWKDGFRTPRSDIHDDCEVIAVDLEFLPFGGRLQTCIAVYVGERLGGVG